MTAIAAESVRQIELGGRSVPYTLRRSVRARHLRVTIDPARGVILTIPTRGSIRAGEAFLHDREPWILRHLARNERRLARLADRGPSGPGGQVLFRGEPHRVRVERAEPGTRRSRVLRVGGAPVDELVIVVAAADRRSPTTVLEAWFRERAAAAIDADIARHAPAVGVTPAAVTLRDPKTRWGSASRARRLSFSWRLILAPPEALETVVVHELAHLRVFGHGPAFWALVASRLPDHRRWRAWLREHSLELHAALTDPPITEGQRTLEELLAI